MTLSAFSSEVDLDDLPEPTDDELTTLDAELERIERQTWDERDARLAFAIRAAVEDLALATLSPWSTEPPY